MATGKKSIYAAIVGNSLIAVTRFVAAGITGSSAMLSEGVHSLLRGGRRGERLPGDPSRTTPLVPGRDYSRACSWASPRWR